jgi:hypothetical protein
MSEIFSVFPVLFLIYVLQGIAVVPQHTAVFLIDSRLRGKLLRRSWRVGRSENRLFLLNPFFHFSRAIYTTGHPFSFLAETEGEVSGIDFAHFAATAGCADTAFTFDVAHRFAARFKQLLVDDSPAARLHSEHSAARLAALLNKLQPATPSERRSLLDKELLSMLAVGPVRKRLRHFSQCTGPLDALCFSLFLFLFVVAPVYVYVFGLFRAWPGLLMALILFAIAILRTFRNAHRRLYPNQSRDLQHVLTITLSPLAAIRATDPLATELLADFHPMAVAYVLLPREQFLPFAEKELRRIKFLTRDAILEKYITGFLSAHKFDLQSLLKPPTPDDARSRTYCPACLTQYVVEEGACQECSGVHLQKFPAVRL